ncbi:MAG: hypothetical protein J7M14_02150 [Planctomycetes bacterium]|nr:hypothetical protein [Planctomycetota bacterium]
MQHKSNVSAIPPVDLCDAVAQCRDEPACLTGLAQVYALVDAEVAAIGAICLGGGVCCKFDLCSHRLYVSTAELALLTTAWPANVAQLRLGRCPYQQGPRCLARARRPLGCRTYFCRSTPQNWCSETYEKHHALIKQLHERLDLPYTYVELTRAMAELLIARPRA